MKINQKKNIRILFTFFYIFLPVTGIILIHEIYANQIAKTEDGKTVLLKKNGTWEYIDLNSKGKNPAPLKSADFNNSIQKPGTSTSGKKVSKKPVTFSNKELATIAQELNINEGSDFRDAKWGMTLQQVKNLEKLRLITKGANLLEYEYTLIGMRCKVIYYFDNNSLTKAQYKLDRKHYDPANFNRDYLALKKYLIGMYGEPNSDQDNWYNDQYKSDKTKWGFAVSIGFLTRIAIWNSSRSKIVIEMLGENHKAFINIKYSRLNISK